MKIYVDSGVYLDAWRHQDPAKLRAARDFLADPSHHLVATKLTELELLGKPRFLGLTNEVQFLTSMLSLVNEWVHLEDSLVSRAIEIAVATDAQGMDALHLAAAEQAGVDIFMTSEKSTKPLFRFTAVNPTSLFSG